MILIGQIPISICYLIIKSHPRYFDVRVKSLSVTSTIGEGTVL